MINIKMFPASYGDCFMVSCNGKNKTNILIDMGFASTYDTYIRSELMKMKNEGISLLIFTHVDDDHILGGIPFIKENGSTNNPEIIDIKEIWYNSYRHMQFSKQENNDSEVIPDDLNEILEKGHPREVGTRVISDIGYEKGSTLASLLYKNGYAERWNKSFDYNAVTLKDSGPNTYVINDEVHITILSPSKDKLDLLGQKWGEKLASIGYETSVKNSEIMDDAFEIYMANEKSHSRDRSVESIASAAEEIEDIINKEF
jgi:hypothetical protein